MVDCSGCSGWWRYVGFDGEGTSYELTSKDLTDHMVSKPEQYVGKLNRLKFIDGKEDTWKRLK